MTTYRSQKWLKLSNLERPNEGQQCLVWSFTMNTFSRATWIRLRSYNNETNKCAFVNNDALVLSDHWIPAPTEPRGIN